MSDTEKGQKSAGFAAFFRNPDVRAPVVWSALGRMPLYLVSLGLVLYVADRTGSYATAGLVLAAYTVGGAAFGPFIAREVDRRGQRIVLPITGVLFPVLLVGLVYSLPDRIGVTLVWALLAGGAIPPVSGAIRALWGTWLTKESERQAAYAMEAVLAEVFVITGPLLLSLLIAYFSAGTAILVGAVIACLGAVGLSFTKAGRELAVTGDVKRDWAGPLRSRSLVLLFVVLMRLYVRPRHVQPGRSGGCRGLRLRERRRCAVRLLRHRQRARRGLVRAAQVHRSRRAPAHLGSARLRGGPRDRRSGVGQLEPGRGPGGRRCFHRAAECHGVHAGRPAGAEADSGRGLHLGDDCQRHRHGGRAARWPDSWPSLWAPRRYSARQRWLPWP